MHGPCSARCIRGAQTSLRWQLRGPHCLVMKQADIASFFTRKAGTELTPAAAQAADAKAPSLNGANGTEKKRGREVWRMSFVRH